MSSDYAGKLGSSRRLRRRIQRRSQLLESASGTAQISIQTSISPRWSPITKLLVGLVMVGIIAFLLSRFANLVTPLLIVFIISYLFHPLTSAIARGLNVSWRAAVNILYLLILVLLIGLVTLGGVGLVQQVQSLIGVIQDFVTNLPKYVADISGQVYQIGPFILDMRRLDLNAISQQLLSFVQPLLGRTGNIVGALASGAAEVFGWTFFVLLVSYFVMVESSGLQSDLFRVEVPGYSEDLRRLGKELSRIWNAFLRGQIFIFTLATVIYIILLSILGVRYAIGLAFMAGLAKFLPYIGPAITWVVMALVTLIQDNPFGLEHWVYAAIVVTITLVIDQIIDSFITPRIMARTLRVHPAAVLVIALIAANLLGILGVVIAAPFLASITLLGKYIMRKMLDLEPWPEKEGELPSPVSSEWIIQIRKLWTATLRMRGRKQEKTDIKKESMDEQQ
jgi:predicted PurR-regulated permease PerM